MRRCGLLLVGLGLCTAWGCGSTNHTPETTSDSGAGGAGGSSASGGQPLAGSQSTSGAPQTTAGAANAGQAGEADGGGGVAQGGAGATETVTLKVLTLNTPNYPSALAAQDILDSGADVVGLQEVSPAEAADIRAALGQPWVFAQEDRANTHAIVSKLPILQRIGVTQEARGGLGVTIEVEPGLHAHLFDTHGMWTPYGPYQLGVDGLSVASVLASEEAVRMPGLRELLGLAAPHIQSEESTFLVGDFNAPSHLDYAPAVAWPTSVAPLEAGLVDSYAELHPGNAKKSACQFAIDDPGITWTQLPASEPEDCFDRIDFIYYSKDDAKPIESHTIDVKASDHRAVLTTFELRQPVSTEQARPQLPAVDAKLVSRHALLTWVPGRDALSEELVIGTATPSATVASVGLGYQRTDLLAPNTTYAWRIDTLTASGKVAGMVRQFTTKNSGGLSTERSSFEPQDAINIQFDNADSPQDWIGLYPLVSAYGPDSPAASWKYLNDTDTAPQTTVSTGSIALPAPSAPGSYAIRFFNADGYEVEDEVLIAVE